jgi:radical SAM-linked protein
MYRLAFTKTGRARFLSHLDLSTTLLRALARARLPILFSEGFHPHPKISFAFATPVGMESLEEYADIQSEVLPENTDELLGRINACLPDGVKIILLRALPPVRFLWPRPSEASLFPFISRMTIRKRKWSPWRRKSPPFWRRAHSTSPARSKAGKRPKISVPT